MDDDWDLHAVVRRFAAAAAANTVPTSNGTAAAASNNQHFPSFPSNLPHHNDPNSFPFSGLVDGRNDPFQVGQGIYQQLYVGDPPPAIAASIIPVPPPLVIPPNQYVMQVGPPLPLNMQIQENAQFGVSPALGSPSPLQNLPAPNPQPINRPRKRKSQQAKMVRIMSQEEITADSWAWRKYGQKPIKGSPHPRNYYRCSTSKGCGARKLVERSSNDPELFVVSYSGEHTHPRPVHRNSLSGTTRSKVASPPARSRRGSRNAALSQNGSMGSTSSPAASSSFSPATPSIEGEAAAGNGDLYMAEQGDAYDDENAIMIPNDFMNEDDDMFRAFQDIDDHSSGGDFFTSGLLSSPPWTPTSPAGNASSLNGGGE